jgi:hypothetical protein
MSTQTGLSRRRVAAASSSNDIDDEEQNKSTRPTLAASQSTSSSFSDINGARSSHAGTALAGGSKVAYDPRDLVGSGSGGDEEGRVPKLTLLEEILLLGIKDRAVSAFLDLSRCVWAVFVHSVRAPSKTCPTSVACKRKIWAAYWCSLRYH